MKKIFGLALILAVLISIFPVPAMAAPADKLVLESNISQETYQGRTEEFFLRVKNTGKSPANLSWTLKLPVASFSLVSINGKALAKTGGFWTYGWSQKNLKKGQYVDLRIRVIFNPSVTGRVRSLEIIKSKNLPTLTFDTLVKPAVLTWWYQAQPELDYNTPFVLDVKVNTPITINLQAYNPSGLPLEYNVNTHLFTYCTVSTIRVTPETWIGFTYDNQYSWRGTVEPGGVVNWTFQLVSSSAPCQSDKLFELLSNDTGTLLLPMLGINVK